MAPAPLGKNYYRLWSASAASNLGDGITMVAWPWLASLLTRDPFAIAVVATVLRSPWFFFSLPAGVITDRVDRKRLVLSMDILRAGLLLTVMLCIFLIGPEAKQPNLTLLYGILLMAALLTGMAEVLRDNAAQTLMPSIVPAERLEAANGRLWSVEVLANSLIGPPLAGFLIALSLTMTFAFSAASFAVSALLIFTLKGSFQHSHQQNQKNDWKSELKEGLAFLWRNPLLRDLAIILGVFNATHQMMMIALILFSQEVLGLTSTGFGLLLTAAAVGGIIGGFIAEKVAKILGNGTALRAALLVGVVQFSIVSVATDPSPIWIVFIFGEIMGMVWNTITVSLRQRNIPDELLGRVNSAYRFFGWGMMPLGLLLSGIIVTVAENFVGRDVALRMPFFTAALILAAATLIVWPRLSNEKLKNIKFQ